VLSLQTLREETDRVRESCALRGVDVSIDRVLELDDERRAVLADVERMRADRNQAGKLIGAAKDDEERQRLIDAQRAVADELDALEERLRETQSALDELLLEIPNLPHADVPLGDYEDSVIVIEGDGESGEETRLDPPRSLRDEGEPSADSTKQPHWDLGEALGIIDFERGVKISGSQFYILRDDGARLQRALIAWMLDLHREQGYSEVYPPALVLSESLVGTGNLPKFADTMFHAEGTDLWMIPTAEVPVTNMYRDEILDVDDLPVRHTAYTPNFRREQFSAGRDVRGIKRGYQFDKVEMVRFEQPDASWAALDTLLEHALEVVRALGFRYRVIRLAMGDLSFSSSMTYDIEIWAAGSEEWLEVSSVSNFVDFQARRTNLRYRDGEGRVRHLHTLNGSGLALPRTLATVLEQYQREDGSVEVPEVLRLYIGGLEVIEAGS
jgi:seryl-tRNA synthetase